MLERVRSESLEQYSKLQLIEAAVLGEGDGTGNLIQVKGWMEKIVREKALENVYADNWLDSRIDFSSKSIFEYLKISRELVAKSGYGFRDSSLYDLTGLPINANSVVATSLLDCIKSWPIQEKRFKYLAGRALLERSKFSLEIGSTHLLQALLLSSGKVDIRAYRVDSPAHNLMKGKRGRLLADRKLLSTYLNEMGAVDTDIVFEQTRVK
jgi:hypothetical protein